jgi:hypothetical protein
MGLILGLVIQEMVVLVQVDHQVKDLIQIKRNLDLVKVQVKMTQMVIKTQVLLVLIMVPVILEKMRMIKIKNERKEEKERKEAVQKVKTLRWLNLNLKKLRKQRIMNSAMVPLTK